MRNYRMKGNYTVEAAFLFPVLFILLAFVLKICIQLYTGVENTAENITWLLDMQAEQLFRNSIHF